MPLSTFRQNKNTTNGFYARASNIDHVQLKKRPTSLAATFSKTVKSCSPIRLFLKYFDNELLFQIIYRLVINSPMFFYNLYFRCFVCAPLFAR